MPETIVLGYDASPSANAALAETVRLAPLLGADVCVVFGYYMSPYGGPAAEGESSDFVSSSSGSALRQSSEPSPTSKRRAP